MALFRSPKKMCILALLASSLAVALCSFCGCKKNLEVQVAMPVTGQNKGVDPALLARAQAGDAAAQRKLGYAFDLGQGAPQDYSQAFAWYSKAADQGDAKAQLDLGVLYREGHGLQQDFAQASIWFRKAAEQGNSNAQHSLGLLYYYGQGVTQDYAQAAFWYRKAADQGDAEAQYGLGYMYYLV
jgi:TPR repeat protein